MWTEARSTFQALNRFCSTPDNQAAFDNFFTLLTRNIERLRIPLQNRPKSLAKRGAINKTGAVEIELSGDRRVMIDDETIKAESLALSDHFNLDELDALELILAGELQARNFHEFTRAQCAIICYYDAHRYWCLLLKSLLVFHANHHLSNDASTKIRKYTSELLADKSIYCRLLDSFACLSVESEFERLGSPHRNALGGPSHQEKLRLILADIERNCFEVLCLLSIYCPAEKQSDLLAKAFPIVAKFDTSNPFTTFQLAAWTSLLLFINPVRLKQQCDGTTEIFAQFNSSLSGGDWENRCVKATVTFAFGIAIKYARKSLGLNVSNELMESDLVDDAITNMALESLHVYVLRAPIEFSRFAFTVDVVDSLLKNFICYFREKLIEMFNLCEYELARLAEAGSSDGDGAAMEAPSYSHLHFKSLLELLTALYEPNTDQLRTYSEQFTSPKCESLYDFILTLRATITAPALIIAYLSMLSVLCKSQHSSSILFNMFR